MKRFISILTLVLSSLSASAYDDEYNYYGYNSTIIDGFYYQLNSDNKTAAFSYKYKLVRVPNTTPWDIKDMRVSYDSDYSGDVHIPNEVVYEGETYTVTAISDYAFFDCCGLTSVTIPNSVTSIGLDAFYKCSSLTSITIPNSITYIGDRAFIGCSGLTSVTIPNSVESISDGTFRDCTGLPSISIPESVTSIGYCAFYGCTGLTSINIPENVTTIGSYAFSGCTGLIYATLPSRLASIGNYAFYNCYNLIDVYCHAEKVSSADNSSFSNSSDITLHVPSATIEAYKSTEPWNQFKAYVALSDGESQGKCAKPTINIVDGKAVFDCETPGVSFHWSVSTSSGSSGGNFSWNNSIILPITLNVFATKDGYENSDVATYEFFGINGDVNGDGLVNVADHVKLSEIIMNK